MSARFRILRRLAPFGVALLTAACYRLAPRHGPLAAVADSLVIEGTLTCLEPEHTLLFFPKRQSCAVGTVHSDGFGSSFSVNRTGRVLDVVRHWVADSAGLRHAAALATSLAHAYGPGDTVAREGIFGRRWRRPGSCVSLLRLDDQAHFELVYTDSSYLDPCLAPYHP